MLSGGLSRYRSVLSLPGARGPVAASILGSLPIGMFGLAILLLGTRRDGVLRAGRPVAGAFGLANAIGAVMQGRLMDRLGQTRVLRPAAAVHLVAVACARRRGRGRHVDRRDGRRRRRRAASRSHRSRPRCARCGAI